MLRWFFVSLSKAGWAQRLITHWSFAWRAASRFVAGETAAEGLKAVRDLNTRGIQATLDHLGESTTSREEAHNAADEVISLLEKIEQHHLRANVSLKLSQIGLVIDPALCQELLFNILTKAREQNNFIRIDMEDSSLTTPTLALYHAAREQGFDNVGIVLQAYLYRTGADLDRILARHGRVRLCKGAYKEPASVAFPRKADVDENFDRLARSLIQGALEASCPALSDDGRFPPIPALATHDPARIWAARQFAEEVGLPQNAMEFQMLYGIRRDLQDQLAASGYPVRVYVPYGTHWYPYFMRRLGERPENIWFFVAHFFRQ